MDDRAPGGLKHVSSASTIRGSNIGLILIALLPSQSAPSGKAPKNETAGRSKGSNDGEKQDYLLSRAYTPTKKQQSGPSTGEQEPTAGSNTSAFSHESTIPNSPAINQKESGKPGRKNKAESTVSGWWGALSNVINRPSAEYDPKNVV